MYKTTKEEPNEHTPQEHGPYTSNEVCISDSESESESESERAGNTMGPQESFPPIDLIGSPRAAPAGHRAPQQRVIQRDFLNKLAQSVFDISRNDQETLGGRLVKNTSFEGTNDFRSNIYGDIAGYTPDTRPGQKPSKKGGVKP